MTIVKRSIASLLRQTSSVAENEAQAFEAMVVFAFTEEGSETAPLTKGMSGS